MSTGTFLFLRCWLSRVQTPRIAQPAPGALSHLQSGRNSALLRLLVRVVALQFHFDASCEHPPSFAFIVHSAFEDWLLIASRILTAVACCSRLQVTLLQTYQIPCAKGTYIPAAGATGPFGQFSCVLHVEHRGLSESSHSCVGTPFILC